MMRFVAQKLAINLIKRARQQKQNRKKENSSVVIT